MIQVTLTPLLVDADAVAAMLGVSGRTVYAMQSTGELGPMALSVGGRWLWRTEELTRWVAAGCASPIRDRMVAFREAHAQGLRTYGTRCPILPGVTDSSEQIDELVRFACECGIEEIFAEAVNRRGRGLILTRKALAEHGYHLQAEAIAVIRNRVRWSRCAVGLIQHGQCSVRRFHDISKLRFLLYLDGFAQEDLTRVRQDDAGVAWLCKKQFAE